MQKPKATLTIEYGDGRKPSTVMFEVESVDMKNETLEVEKDPATHVDFMVREVELSGRFTMTIKGKRLQ